MFKQGAEEALPQLRILLQIRRVGFILSVNIFLIFMIYLAFSKFGQLRIGGQSLSLNLKHFLGLQCYSVREWGLLLFWSISEPIYHFLSPPNGRRRNC
jgi:choline/glycine/proline betaine transport protein